MAEEMISKDPFRGVVIKRYPLHSLAEARQALVLNQKAQLVLANWTIQQRSKSLYRLASLLEDQVEKLALQISAEMGKVITEARAEVKKCAWVCRYYAENAAAFLAERPVPTEAHRAWVRFDPLGSILAIMPWNFPAWQFFRLAAPALATGNGLLLKHAPNVQGTAESIAPLAEQAGFPRGIVQNLRITPEDIASLMAEPGIKAVSLTGSVGAGRAVAAAAGKQLKKTVMELGGSNAFVILPSAPWERSVELAVKSRMQNNGQSCIAAKRFLVPAERELDFARDLRKALQAYRVEDPRQQASLLGPLARPDLAENLADQVERAQQAGAEKFWGEAVQDCAFPPHILTGVGQGNPAFEEELFGPVFALCPYRSIEEAFALSQANAFGLGLTVMSGDPEKEVVPHLGRFADGAVFINALVKSDPRLPFGGTKNSGYGRELSLEGMREFVNVKTVYWEA